MQEKIIEHYKDFTSFDEFLRFLELEITPKNIRRVRKILKRNGISHKFIVRRSAITKASREEMQNIVDSSNGLGDILDKFNIRRAGGNYLTLHKRCDELGIDFSSMMENKRNSKKCSTTSWVNSVSYEQLINRTTSRTTIKRYIINHDLIPYWCTDCGNKGEHNGKELILQLDHINGVYNDNRIENLRFLCPNCHSQTPTFSGKSGKNSHRYTKKSMKMDEKKIVETNANGEVCCRVINKYKKRANTNRPRKFNVEYETLMLLVENNSLSAIGRMYGVSDNAVRKRCKSFGIDLSINKFSIKKKI